MPTPHVPGDPMAASHSGRPPAVRSGRAAAPAAAAPPGQPPAAHPQPAPAVPQTCTLVPTLPPSQPVLRARDHNPSRTSSELLQNPGSAEKDSQALRRDIAKALKLDAGAVRCVHAEGSGCYGHNGADDVALDAAMLARAVPGRP